MAGRDAAAADGAFVRHAAWGDTAHLVWGNWLLAWTAGGSVGRLARPKNLEVLVLTPESTAGVIRAGYAPDTRHDRPVRGPAPRADRRVLMTAGRYEMGSEGWEVTFNSERA